MSQPIRAAWIEIEVEHAAVVAPAVSQPIRAAWIEMYAFAAFASSTTVAAHSGCVD